jgi:hypothetical protein
VYIGDVFKAIMPAAAQVTYVYAIVLDLVTLGSSREIGSFLFLVTQSKMAKAGKKVGKVISRCDIVSVISLIVVNVNTALAMDKL